MRPGLLIVVLLICLGPGCTENYSNGERVGMVTQFSYTGVFYKSYEGHLNLTQTGMNSSVPFDFSLDRDTPDRNAALVTMIDSAADHGWKVKLGYHEVYGWNCFHNRGETDHFVTSCEVLDRNPIGSAFQQLEGRSK